jgi:hypothetical protein
MMTLAATFRQEKGCGRAAHYHPCYLTLWLICSRFLSIEQRPMAKLKARFHILLMVDYQSFNMLMMQFFLCNMTLRKLGTLNLFWQHSRSSRVLRLTSIKANCFVLAKPTLYAELFGYGQGKFPIRYLGISIHYRRLAIAEWKLVKERLQKHLSSWKG